MNRNSYCRKTEVSRDSHRDATRTEARGEQSAFVEAVADACQRFFNDRGMVYENEFGQEYIGTPRKPVNRIEAVSPNKWLRRYQPPSPAKSYKAACFREVVMRAREAGLIRKTPFETPGLDKWQPSDIE